MFEWIYIFYKKKLIWNRWKEQNYCIDLINFGNLKELIIKKQYFDKILNYKLVIICLISLVENLFYLCLFFSEIF